MAGKYYGKGKLRPEQVPSTPLRIQNDCNWPHQRTRPSLHPIQFESPKELSNVIWRHAMINKKNSQSDTHPDTPTPPNDSVGVGVSSPPNSPVLDNTAALVNQPPKVEYLPQFDYQLHEDYSRLDANEYSYYNPIERTFSKRKFNTSYGSDQSSLNRTPVKHVAKRGKLENEFWEVGVNDELDRTLVSGFLDISGPNSEENKVLDKTWKPCRTPSDSDDDYQDELESTDLRGRSMDRTWMPERPQMKPSIVQCVYCSTNFSNQREKFAHIIEVHGDGLTDAVFPMMPDICTNCTDENESTAFCNQCLENPFLCNPCVLAHRRVGLTKDHGIIFRAQYSAISHEGPFVIFEKILDSVYPDRRNPLKESDLPDPPDDPEDFIPMRCASSDKANSEMEEELKVIRQQSLTLASCLNQANGCEASVNASASHSSRSSSENSSLTDKTLTGKIIADNLLPMFNVESVDVKAKVAVVIEMLVRMNSVDPSLFCDERSMRGFRSLLSIRDTKFLYKALTSLDQLVMAVGKKGIFFVLVKIRSELSGLLEMIQQPSTELDYSQTSIFNPSMVKNLAGLVLKKLDGLIG